MLAMEMRFRTAEGEPVELTIARHRADLFSLSYDVPNDALRNAGKIGTARSMTIARMDRSGNIIIA